jgi:murein DD-endopeptidase MepM/ murein hydrolase activator NlpD
MKDTSLIAPMTQIPMNMLNSSGGRLENRLQAVQGVSGAKQKAELKKVSQEFEAVFIAHLLKVMRETIEESGLLEGGFGKSTYTELFDQEVSLSLARRGALGISNLLYKNLSEKIDNTEKQKPDQTPNEDPTSSSTISGNPSPNASNAHNVSEEEIPDFQLPVRAPISSAFGMRKDPFSHQAKFHKGLDLSAPEGMNVVPALAGTVVFAGYRNGYGNTVVVQHSGELQTRYGHMGSIAVRVGDTVDSQNTLGTVGSTGRSTGTHLHFEVIRNGQAVDPAANLKASIAGSRAGNQKMGG